MKKNNNEFSLGEAIDGFLEDAHLKDRLLMDRVLTHWGNYVGEVVAKQTEKIWFHKGIFYVQMKSPVWQTEVWYRHSELIALINKELGRETVKEMRVFCGG